MSGGRVPSPTTTVEAIAMRRTLFLIPHDIASIPLFGFGWLLALLVLGVIAVSVRQIASGGRLADYWARNGLFWGLLAAVVIWGLPLAELENVDGQKVGLPVRGYGVMLLCGVVAGVWLAIERARRYGLVSDVIWGIAPWAIIGGLLGARLFYVIEYRDQFFVSDPLTTFRRIANFTEGGLVVYGSFIGGFLGGIVYILRQGLSVLTVGDVILPTLFIGLALGRIGCLFNGCCYGAACDDQWWALYFPNGSPVYQDQLVSGQLVGIELSPDRQQVTAVRPGSLAAAKGIQVGQPVSHLGLVRSSEAADPARPAEETPLGLVAEIGGREFYWSANELPARADPVLPSQLISSAGALLLCLGLCLASRFIRRPGMILFAAVIGYAVMRFAMEMLRSDEPGQFGTELTISQWVSVVVFGIASISLVLVLLRDRRRTAAEHAVAEKVSRV